MVGAIGFEPTTPCSRSRCATRLRYAPNLFAVSVELGNCNFGSVTAALDRNVLSDLKSLADFLYSAIGSLVCPAKSKDLY